MSAPSLAATDPGDYNILIAASHASAGLSIVGAVLNGALLASAIRHRTALVLSGPYSTIGLLIAIILTLSLLLALLNALLNELWVYSVTAPGVSGLFDSLVYSVGLATSLSSVVYLLLHALFSANLLLAIERHWLVRFGMSVSRLTIGIIFGVGTVFALLTSASLCLSTGIDWAWLPLGKPFQNITDSWYDIGPAQSTLFLIGLSYYPLVALVICLLYENTYFQITRIFDDRIPVDDTDGTDSDKNSPSQHVSVQRSALIRCLLMSIGLVVWYCPSIITLYASVIDENIETWVNQYIWSIVVFGIMPSLDALWTFIVIVQFQLEFRDALMQDVSQVLAWIVCVKKFGYRGRPGDPV